MDDTRKEMAMEAHAVSQEEAARRRDRLKQSKQMPPKAQRMLARAEYLMGLQEQGALDDKGGHKLRVLAKRLARYDEARQYLEARSQGQYLVKRPKERRRACVAAEARRQRQAEMAVLEREMRARHAEDKDTDQGAGGEVASSREGEDDRPELGTGEGDREAGPVGDEEQAPATASGAGEGDDREG